MSLSIIYTRAPSGIAAPLVTVETHLSGGLPKFSIVGLPEAAVKESKDRVRSALLNTHFEFPDGRITVNLAPADLPKIGSRFDLPIAIGILAASGQIPKNILHEYEFTGELALSGDLRPIQGTLPFALGVAKTNRQLILPYSNMSEAALVHELTILPAKHITEVCLHLCKEKYLSPYETKTFCLPKNYLDLSDVMGQQQARRALEITAAGGHSLLLLGPPGTGKTMLASRLPGILPPMDEKEAVETAAIASTSHQGFDLKSWRCRPFRAPHHSTSSIALVGGSNPPKPGEISLAHNGVLFLDELPEFNRHVLEALREPLESGVITISRAAHQTEFPARFQLIAAMNPCPCGYLGDMEKVCRCTPKQIAQYRAKISGPFLDRIDMHVEVSRLPHHLLIKKNLPQENSETVKRRVCLAVQRQLSRTGKLNAKLTNSEIKQFCGLGMAEKDLLKRCLKKSKISVRSFYRLLKVARTIADLANAENITTNHLAEAITLRRLDDA